MSYLKEVPGNEMPFERIEKYGPSVLSDAELLAILIRTGTTKSNPVKIAQEILIRTDNKGLIGLMNISKRELLDIDGIGEVKAVQLLALSEISKRISRQNAHSNIKLQDPATVADYYMELLRHEKEEQVWVAAFDTKYTLISDIMLSRGTSNAALITPKEVFKYALSVSADSIILLHNHPSGDPSPSSKDFEITDQVRLSGNIMGIPMVDHIIIGDNKYFSMKEYGYIE